MSLQKRSPSSPPSTHDLKHRVITCLNKLADRDTLALATAELDSIARNLSQDSFSPFLNCIHNTDSSSKSPVRKQCVNLLALLSNSHGNSLSPHLSKMISTVVRRLRDPDSAVRSACVDAIIAMSSQITKPPFSALSKPLVELLVLEQDVNSQIGAAMCLAAAIEAAPEPEVEQLRKVLPRFGKLVKSEGFKAKAALLGVVGSIVGAGGAGSRGVLDWLVPCVVEFLTSEDWAARKAAAEALGRMAVAEKELATEHKASCLAALESRRFDKVKVVRETMNRTLELWKEVPGVSGEVSAASQSKSSSIDNCSGGCFPPVTKSSPDVGFKTPRPKKTVPTIRSPPSDSSFVTTAKKESPLKSNDKNLSASIFCRPDHKVAFEDHNEKSEFGVSESGENGNTGNSRPETKYVLFNKIREEKMQKFGGLRSGSRVVPFHDDENSDVVVNHATEEGYENQDIEDLSLIREQLVQIENQQSSLLDLLQRFIGSSQSGMNSLETRVRGLEMALDEMSYDLAISSGRIPTTEAAENTCCKLPGAEFLSSKFWRRTEGRFSSSRFSSGSIQYLNAMCNTPDKNASTETYKPDSHNFQHQNRGGFVVNQLADVRSVLRVNSGFCSNGMVKNIIQDAERVQVTTGLGGTSSAS